MDYFGRATEIGTLCSFGFVVGYPLSRHVCYGVFQPITVVVWTWAYTHEVYSRKTSFYCEFGWPKCLGSECIGAGPIFPKGDGNGHEIFVHCVAPWHIALGPLSQWCLATSVVKIPSQTLWISPTWGATYLDVSYIALKNMIVWLGCKNETTVTWKWRARCPRLAIILHYLLKWGKRWVYQCLYKQLMTMYCLLHRIICQTMRLWRFKTFGKLLLSQPSLFPLTILVVFLL